MHLIHDARSIRADMPGFSAWLRRVSAVPGRLRASEYLSVGTSARFRAHQRRRTITAARAGFLVIAAAALFDGVVLGDRAPDRALLLLGLNGGVAPLGVGGWWLLGHRWLLLGHTMRRRPDPVAAAVTLSLVAATAVTGLIIPALAIESAGYLILIPVLVTLILPWSTSVHVRWLAGSAVLAMGFLIAAPASVLSPDERGDLIVVNLVALAASLAGHALLQLAAIRNHSQLRKITQLRRRADADMQELARVHVRLEETARTDPLTGARNRLRFAEDLRTVRARMSRLGEMQGLIAFDLDRFKLINDERGHLAGDEVLKAVVAAVRGTNRAEDEVYRFGGEEFLVLVRVPDEAGMRSAGERLRGVIAGLAIPHPGNVPHGVVTVSLGAVLMTVDDLAATDDDWLARADVALYEAKAGGRNRVVVAA
jgi:diguanylate cyclase (GGDEF)-like protein